MAIKKKTELAIEEPIVRVRTEEGQQFKKEDSETVDSLRDKILNEWPTKDEGTPIGGEKPPDDKDKAKPPKAVITPAPIKAGEIETDEQLEASLPKVEFKNQDQRQAFEAMRKKLVTVNALARDRDAKLKERDKEIEGLKGKILPDDEVKRLRDADHYVALRAVKSLPKWQEYDKAVEQINGRALDVLKATGQFDPKVLEAIQKRGPIVLSNSANKTKFVNADGSAMTEGQWFKVVVYDKLDRRQQNQFDLLTSEAEKKTSEKETALSEAESNAEKTITEERTKAQEGFTTQANAALEELKAELLPKFDFPLKLPEIMASDSAEGKALKQKQIEQWNKADKEINRELKSVKEIVEVRLKTALYDQVVEAYEELKKQLATEKERADKLQQFKDGIKDSRRLSRTPVTTPQTPPKPESEMTTDEALAASGFVI